MNTVIYTIVVVSISVLSTSVLGQATESPPTPKEMQQIALQNRLSEAQNSLEQTQTVRNRLQADVGVVSPLEEKILNDLKEIEDQLAMTEVDSSNSVTSLLLARRVELILEIEGLRLRAQLLADQEGKARQNQEHSIQQSLAIKIKKRELQKQMLTRAAQLRESGSTSEAEVSQAEIKLLESEMELAEVTNQLEQLLEPSSDLSRIMMELMIKESQLKRIESLLEETKTGQKISDRRAELNSKLESLRAAREAGRWEVIKSYEKNLAEQQATIIWLEMELEALKLND